MAPLPVQRKGNESRHPSESVSLFSPGTHAGPAGAVSIRPGPRPSTSKVPPVNRTSISLRATTVGRLLPFLVASFFLLGLHLKERERLTASPKEATANTYQHLQFVFTSGATGLRPGGGFRIELPVAYGETEPYFWSRPQTEVPDGLGYVRASSPDGAKVTMKLYGIAGGIIESDVQGDGLKPGERILVDYYGLVQSISRKIEFRSEWRESRQTPWRSLEGAPSMRILPAEPATLVVLVPAETVRGADVDVALIFLDKFGNRASGYVGTIRLSSTDTKATIPELYRFTPSDSGIHVFRGIKFNTAGFQRITATDQNLVGRSNYSLVLDSPPVLRRYFGDTHFHTGTGTRNRGFVSPPDTEGPVGDINSTSLARFAGINLGGDHRGNFTTEEEAYSYVRDVVRLDFASASEHDAELFDSLAWTESQTIADRFNDPGRFTTFYAYEWTNPAGHHIVEYKERGGKVLAHRDYPTLSALWNGLDRQGVPALTIPHVTWPDPGHRIWQQVNNIYRKVGEIYSLWNGRFLVQPNDDPQRFELGPENAWSYQYAWTKGHRIGVIGSTDNHLGHPGANNFTIYTQHAGGIAVALARGNSREELWDAFTHRRTYATTGTRIWLDFSMDGHPMGEEYETGRPPTISARAAGTNTVRTLEVVRHSTDGFRTIYTAQPDSEIVQVSFVDSTFTADSMYYVRVTQVEEYPGRPFSTSTSEMAWSSPIWVKYRN